MVTGLLTPDCFIRRRRENVPRATNKNSGSSRRVYNRSRKLWPAHLPGFHHVVRHAIRWVGDALGDSAQRRRRGRRPADLGALLPSPGGTGAAEAPLLHPPRRG